MHTVVLRRPRETVKYHPPCYNTATIATRRTASTSMYILANILRSRYVARTPPLEARSPGRRSNAENAPSTASHRPASHAHFPYMARNFENAPRQPPVTGQQRTQTPPSRPFAQCRHIAGWTQACNYGSRYLAIATQFVHRLQIRPKLHN